MTTTLDPPALNAARRPRTILPNVGAIAHSPDVEFVARLRDGDGTAFEELVRQHGPRLLAVARKMLPCEHDAADALQNAFVAAFRSIHQFDGASRLSTWLHRIVVNACLMILRSRQRRPACSLDDLSSEFDSNGRHSAPVQDWTTVYAERLSSFDTAAQVRSLVEQLPEPYRAVVALRDLQGLDTATTSRLLGTNEAVVKTRLHRARRMLRKLVGEVLTRRPEYSSIA